ncbi:transporter substrate-binding domain-containing protein [Enterococcus nangangensis]|uniref:transporter substrate-binding domain-containing protein n=1 Tax=Enterococcus nangangensis TaxID=2559926 RepID=UPI0010F5E1F4|nr:transporter substrate-binding domain-containing protein [Enterococcus nangangensis]
MKKFLGLLFAVGTLTLLSACATSTDKTSSSSATNNTSANNDDKLAQIKEAGVLVMGTSPDFPPFEFPDANGDVVGIDVDIANAVAEELGVELKVMQLSFDNLLPSLQAGKIDVALAGVSATEERQKSADFSTPYFTPTQKIVIQKANADTYTSVDSLDGKKVGAQKGSIQEGVAESQLPKASLVSIPSNATMLIQLKSGGLDAMVMEGAVAENYVAQNADLVVADIDLTSADDESYAVALPKNSGDLKTEIDKVIEQLIADKKIDEFVTKNTELSDQSAD